MILREIKPKTIAVGCMAHPMQWQNKRRDDWQTLLPLLIVFIICPFAAFLLALTNARSRSSYVIYALFGMIFAWHLNHTGAGGYDDLIGIMDRFKNTRISFSQVFVEFIDTITFSYDAPKEWYERFMICMTKNFSDNPHLYFFFCSIPWLFFELSSLNKITSDSKFHQSFICIIILLLFVAPRDIITLQNPRFTTATWMSVFLTINYFTAKRYNNIYAVSLVLTPLIHSAFWFYVIAFVSANILREYPKLTIKLLYISIPFSFLSYDLFTSINYSSLPLPASLSNWIKYYLSEEYYDQYVSQKGASGFYWVGNMFNFIMKTAYLMIPIYLMKSMEQIRLNKSLYKFCGFFIGFYAIVSFIQFVPVLGVRFYWLVRILGIFIWFKAIYPRHSWVVFFILFGCSFEMFRRYFYGGAVSISVPLDIFYYPLPILISDYL